MEGLQLIALLLVTMSSAVGKYVPGCPKPCECHSSETVDCALRNLLEIPTTTNTDNYFTNVDLSHNNLAELGTDLDSFLQVKFLYLADNNISKMSSLLFSELRNLQMIHLGNNRIAELHPSLFYGSPSLKMVSLLGNRLQTTEPFPMSVSITRIDLSENNIKTIHSEYFSLVKNLQFLNIRNNQLQTLPKDIFTNLTKLQRAFLAGNPWLCDDMEEFIQNHSNIIQDLGKVRCFTTQGERRHLMGGGWKSSGKNRRFSTTTIKMQPRSSEGLLYAVDWKHDGDDVTDMPDNIHGSLPEPLTRPTFDILLVMMVVLSVLINVIIISIVFHYGKRCRHIDSEIQAEMTSED